METALELLFLVGIGAAIGGVTNSLAIKMLFRPYYPVYIGRWRIPLTPGLIPKRRNELAEQLGDTVMKHLVTSEGIEQKLRDAGFQEEIVKWAKRQTGQWLDSEHSLEVLLERQFQVNGLEDQIDNKVESTVRSVFDRIRDEALEDVLPNEWVAKAEKMIPELADTIIDESVRYIRGPEGRIKTQALIEQFLSGRGMFSNMVQMFLGNESLGDKLQTEFVKLLRQPMCRDMLTRFLNNEWTQLKKRRIGDWPINDISQGVSLFVKQQLPMERWLRTPLCEWTPPFREMILDKWVPRLVDWAGRMTVAHVDDILKSLRLEEVVKGQVNTFAVERLEELVLSISRREFKLITYLGALLGGVIGLFQGLIIQIL